MRRYVCQLEIELAGSYNQALARDCCNQAIDRGWEAYRAIEQYSIDSGQCRRQQLLDHFGDERAPKALARCCDVCDLIDWLSADLPEASEPEKKSVKKAGKKAAKKAGKKAGKTQKAALRHFTPLRLLNMSGLTPSKVTLVATLLLWASFAALALCAAPALAQASPTKVYTGVYVNDIQDVNLETDTYTVAFYIWMRWNNPKVDPSSEIDLMNSYDSWGTVERPATEKPVRLKDGSMYRLIHYQGKFNTKFPLTKYPFDKQDLTVQIEDFNSSSEKVVFVPDAKPVQLASGLSLPGYEVGKPTMTIADQPYSTTFGDTGLKAPADYSRITVTVPVTRPGLPYTVKLLLPMLVVLLCAGLVFLISPIHIDGRIALAITALLTLVALKFMVDSELPNVDYLTMVDAIYIVAFVSAGMGLLQVVLSSRRLNRGEPVDVIIARDHKTLMLGGAVYLMVSAIVIAAFLL